ncbi:MAG: hypothetical protein CSA66_06970 [Proteobacteria bacterium]|nr:MAG: hypothetical protein CSA66_06970 [Pseudomonadota bacterium]
MRPHEPLLALADLDHGPGRALLEATIAIGFSEGVARAGLTAETEAWRAPGAVERVLAELPPDLDPARLPRVVLVIAAATLPASALRAVLFARLLGARALLKPATGQAGIAHAIAAADASVEARCFPSADAAALDAAVAEADAVVVLGSDAATEAVRARVPGDKAFVGYGHRVSAAWIHTPDEATLSGLARDLCAWDQAGCLSPRVVWTAGEPERVASELADAVRAVEARLPQRLDAGAARARLAELTRAQMLGRAWRTDTAVVATLPSPAFRLGPGRRFLWVLPADRGALRAIEADLSTLACDAAPPAGLREAVRICGPGDMQRPALDWLHDGLPNLPPLLLPAPDSAAWPG